MVVILDESDVFFCQEVKLKYLPDLFFHIL